jgi:uncharacterized protein (DUF1330 family)
VKAYVIVNVSIRDAERYKDYIQAATPTVAAHGGRYVARGGRAEKLEGDVPVNRVVVLEFPSYAQAKGWYDSPEYQAALVIRQACSTGTIILVEGMG